MENGKWGQGQETSFPEPLLTVNREYPPQGQKWPLLLLMSWVECDLHIDSFECELTFSMFFLHSAGCDGLSSADA